MNRFMVAALAMALIVGCNRHSQEKPQETLLIPPPPVVPEADLRAASESDAAFATDLHRRLGVADGNLIYSPASISHSLAMTYAGASGATANEMKAVLHLTLTPEKLHAVNHKRLYVWNGADGVARAYDLSVANALWGQNDEAWKQEFINLLNERYGAGFHQVDFVNAPEAARIDVNKWVSRSTGDKIPEIVPPGVFNSSTRIALANAVYFMGKWAHPFEKNLTSDLEFHSDGGKTGKSRMMLQTRYFNYAERSGVQVLEMPYEGHTMSMVILLPAKKDGLKELEASLSAAKLKELTEKLTPEVVRVYVPKFKFETSLSLAKDLAAMGMKSAFDPDSANFSAMNGKTKLFLSHVLHKATIVVDEEGSEATAATVEVGAKSAAPAPSKKEPPTFLANHPFVFIIRTAEDNDILFMGRVNDPSR